MMRLLTVGDSFTYGEELSDLNNAWPYVLGKRLGYEVTNLAKPGSGNTRMIRHCIEYINTYDIVVIGWSHFARIEMSDELGTYDVWPGYKGAWFKDELSYRKELVKYITSYYNDQYLYRQYLNNVILLQSYLKLNQKKYVMMDAFGNNQTYVRKHNLDLFHQIDAAHFLGWPNETMMEWTHGSPLGPYGHFLEQGHEMVAEKVYEHIRNLNWFS